MEEDEDDFYAPSETIQLANGSKKSSLPERNGEKADLESENGDRMDESLEEGEEEDEEDDSSGSVRHKTIESAFSLIILSIRKSILSLKERMVQHQKLRCKAWAIYLHICKAAR